MATETVDALARQALDLAKNALLVHVRFMNAAFARLAPFPVRGATLATDGLHVRYDPATLARAYAAEPSSVARDFFHMVLHNVFAHLYPGSGIDVLRWDAACDIVVERTMNELDIPATRVAHTAQQQAALAQLEAELPLFTAETLYRHLKDSGMSDEDVVALRAPFLVDDHGPWHRMLAEEEARKKKQGRSEEGDSGAGAAVDPAKKEGKNTIDMDMPEEAKHAKKTRHAHRAMNDDDIMTKDEPEHAAPTTAGRFADTVNLDRSRDQWKNAAYEMGIQMDSYLKLWGADGSNLAMNLRAVTREKQDYRAFLRKFTRMGEHLRVNDDDFDYVYYCFGLARYGNLPLIEPLEYAEERRIRDFVIAIDTSSSTKDGLVRRFMEKTYAILSNETSFSADMNVLIIQCDADITDVTRVKTLRDLNDYLEALEIKGLGGTDFRPVFSYVDAALERGDISNLGGLLYFTDGHGTFPAHRPAYETAFVFVEDDSGVSVPPWAMKVVLEETALIED